MHRDAPPTLTLEEKINRLAARGDARSLEEVDGILRETAELLALRDERAGLANWAVSALPRLPTEVRRLASAQSLAVAAYLRLSSQLPPDAVSGGADLPEWLSWAIPNNIGWVELGVRLVDGGVEMG